MKFMQDEHDDDKQTDIANLDEIIKRCEASMVGKFKKKDAEPVAVEIDAKDGDEEGDDKPDMDGMDLEELLRMYQEMKDGKGE